MHVSVNSSNVVYLAVDNAATSGRSNDVATSAPIIRVLLDDVKRAVRIDPYFR